MNSYTVVKLNETEKAYYLLHLNLAKYDHRENGFMRYVLYEHLLKKGDLNGVQQWISMKITGLMCLHI